MLVPVGGFSRPSSCLLALLSLALPALPLWGDNRSTEVLRYECSSSLSRRDITLFANGTVRLRQGPLGEQTLYLDELLPEELASYLKRLREVQRSSGAAPVDLGANAPSGDWVENCEVELALPDSAPATYTFSTYEIPPLVVAGLIHIAEDLADFTRSPEQVERLPKGYRPRAGDVLHAREGGRFRVVSLTSDELGVELEELGTPVMIVVPVAEIFNLFSTLEDPDR